LRGEKTRKIIRFLILVFIFRITQHEKLKLTEEGLM